MGRHRRSPGGTHRKQGPARAGLLGASAALTVGAMAVGTGMVPDADRFTLDGGGIQALQTGGSGSAQERGADDAASRGADRDTSPPGTPAPAESPAEDASLPEPGASGSDVPQDTAEPTADASPSPEPEPEPSADVPAPEETPAPEPSPPAQPSPEPDPEPEPSEEPAEDPAAVAAARVLELVNAERAQAGCPALSWDQPLGGLAAAYSRDMAERGFFSHTDPDGDSPWDRAAAAGVDYMGGENIARGQQSAESVMESWMNSEGHRANILNCDFTTLGVGVHIGPGGPWWTQAFGY